MIPISVWHVLLLSIVIGFIGFGLYVLRQEIRAYLKKKWFFKEYDERRGKQVDKAYRALKQKEEREKVK